MQRADRRFESGKIAASSAKKAPETAPENAKMTD